MSFFRVAALGLAIATSACLGSNEEEKYSKLFDSPRTSTVTRDSLRGVWGATTSSGDVTGEWRIAFEADVAHFALRCRFKDGTRLTPGVSIPITYGDSTFTLANGDDDSMKANSGTTCTVSVSGGTSNYRIIDNKMPMIVSGETVMFAKISD